MTMTSFEVPSAADAHTLAMLDSLRTAVAEALERKRRLGQYSVQWSAAGPCVQGPDAPQVTREQEQG